MENKERWQPVVGFEGLYEVSNFGRVRGVDRILTYERTDQYSGKRLCINRKKLGIVLRPAPGLSGHLSVVLGRGNTKSVHVLVATAFIGQNPGGCEVLHFDDDPSNNHLSNLRWGTRSDNLLDAVRNGKKKVGENSYNAKLHNSDIPVIRNLLITKRVPDIARMYGVTPGSIRQIKIGKCWKHA